MNTKQLKILHTRISDAVFDNLGDRRGICHAIDECDDDIVREMKHSVAKDVSEKIGLIRLINALDALADLIERVGDHRKDGPLVDEAREAVAAALRGAK